MKIHHQAYAAPGLVDAEVLRLQAHRRADKEGETTMVHLHAHGIPCSESCYVVEPKKEDTE